jgi:hypothetical protein
MPTYTVRVRYELIQYAEIEIEADNVPEAVGDIKDIDVLHTVQSLAEPGDWDVEHEELSVENITDEDGNAFRDVNALLDAWEKAEEAQSRQ